MFTHALRIFLASILLLPSAWAASTLALVLSDGSAPYAEFATTLGNGLEGSAWKIVSSGKIDSLEPGSRPDLIVAAGSDALRQALARPGNTPVIATLIARPAYDRIVAEAGKPRPRSTAIFIEQPAPRQVAFLRLLLPGRNRVGMLGSPESRAGLTPFRQALQAAAYTLETEEAEGEASLLPAINALLPRVNLLLAAADPSIYKRDNIKAILVTSYRHQKPVVAFSALFVQAGALAALYSTPTQIARQTVDMISLYGANLPPPEYPSQFSISSNRSVAESFSLQLPDDAELRRALMAREAR